MSARTPRNHFVNSSTNARRWNECTHAPESLCLSTHLKQEKELVTYRVLSTDHPALRCCDADDRWMAPEVIRHEPYKESADVYSFGEDRTAPRSPAGAAYKIPYSFQVACLPKNGCVEVTCSLLRMLSYSNPKHFVPENVRAVRMYLVYFFRSQNESYKPSKFQI